MFISALFYVVVYLFRYERVVLDNKVHVGEQVQRSVLSPTALCEHMASARQVEWTADS